MENIFKQNTVKAILFKLQLIYSTLNSKNLKVVIAQLRNELKGCNFNMVQLTQKWVNNTFKENTVNAIVIKAQLINSTVRT